MTPATPSTLPKVHSTVVYLYRRLDGTLWTSFKAGARNARYDDTHLLRSTTIRSVDIVKAKITERLQPFCSRIVFVDPGGQNAF